MQNAKKSAKIIKKHKGVTKMSNTKTKSAMKDDMKLAKAKTLLVRAGVDADETLSQLVAKYGANTYDIVLNAVLKPADMMEAAGQKYANSKRTIEYYAAHEVSADQLVSAIGKPKTEISQKSTQKGTATVANEKTAANANSRGVKFNARVSNRTPSKTAAPKITDYSFSFNKTKNSQKTDTKNPLDWSVPPAKTTDKPKGSSTTKQETAASIPPTGYWFDLNKTPKKETKNPLDWQKFVTPPATPESKAEETYNKFFGARMVNRVSLDELMQQTGVTQADIQAVFRQNPEIIQEMGGGKTNQALAKAASRVSGTCKGGCLGGVQMIYANVSKEKEDMISAQDGAWPEKIPQAGNSNSACNTYIPLEKSGQFITLTYPNKAYNKTEGSKEAEAMKEFNRSLPAGTTVCIDNKIPDGYRGKAGLTDSEIHGHTWVLDTHKVSCSDGRQEDGPKFSRYGENMHISIAKDNYISKDLALKLIKQKQAREAALAQARQNKGRA